MTLSRFLVGRTIGALSDEERWIGSLLLRHLQLLQFNAHEVSELRMDHPGCMEGAKTFFLGAGVYPTVYYYYYKRAHTHTINNI